MLVAVLAALVTLPALVEVNIGTEEAPIISPIAFFAVTSIAVPGLYLSFAIPICLRWRHGDKFEVGEWNNGAKYKWMNPIAVAEIVIVVAVPDDADLPAAACPFDERLRVEVRQLLADRHPRRAAGDHRSGGRSRRRSGSRVRSGRSTRPKSPRDSTAMSAAPSRCHGSPTVSATSSCGRSAVTTRSRAASSSWRPRSGSASTRSGRRCRPSASSPSGWGSRGPRCARRSPALRQRRHGAHDPRPWRRHGRRPTGRRPRRKGGSPGIAERREQLLDSLVFRRVVEPGACYVAASRDADRRRADAAHHGAGRGRPGRRTRRPTGRPTRGCTWRSRASPASPMTIAAVTEVQACLHDMLQAIPVLEVNIEHSSRQHRAIVDGDPRRRADQGPAGDGAALRRHGRAAARPARMTTDDEGCA